MWTRQYKKRNHGRLILPAIAVAFLAYFGFHAFNGDYGIYSKYLLEERAARLNEQLAELRAERIRLESRVQLMHDGTLEKDMLDEQARRALDYSKPDEITILRRHDG